MYAALVTLTIDPEQAPAAAESLVNDILPTVRSAPGFVAGYWLEPADGHGFSIVLFETRSRHAERLRLQTAGPRPGSPSETSSFGEWPPAPNGVRRVERSKPEGRCGSRSAR
jgi:hypothetical protein